MMRKNNQEITDPKILQDILQKATICRLAMLDDGKPYLLPFNYGYKEGVIYIHCAHEGHKTDVLRVEPYVCFEVEETAEIIQNDRPCAWSTLYRSVVGYGSVSFIDDFDEKEQALQVMMTHNGARGPQVFERKEVDKVSILKLSIETMTGKQSGNWNKINEKDPLNLESERLKLVEITIDDLEEIHRLESIPAVDEYNTMGIPESIEVTRQHVELALKAKTQRPRPSYTWKIVLKESNTFIGLAGMFLSNDKFKLGEIYYKLHPDFWGVGYATEVAQALVKAGFDHFDLQKVEAGVATENVRSINVLEKLGMTREGLRRKILPIRGEWKDNYHYAIVKYDQRNY